MSWNQLFKFVHISNASFGFGYLMLFYGNRGSVVKRSRIVLTSMEHWVWSLALGLVFWIMAESLALSDCLYCLTTKLSVAVLILFLIKDRMQL